MCSWHFMVRDEIFRFCVKMVIVDAKMVKYVFKTVRTLLLCFDLDYFCVQPFYQFKQSLRRILMFQLSNYFK